MFLNRDRKTFIFFNVEFLNISTSGREQIISLSKFCLYYSSENDVCIEGEATGIKPRLVKLLTQLSYRTVHIRLEWFLN